MGRSQSGADARRWSQASGARLTQLVQPSPLSLAQTTPNTNSTHQLMTDYDLDSPWGAPPASNGPQPDPSQPEPEEEVSAGDIVKKEELVK